MPRVLAVLGWVLLGLAHVVLIALIGGALAMRTSDDALAGGRTTAGTVVDVRASCGRGHCFYAPVVDYAVPGYTGHLTGVAGNSRPVLGSRRDVSYLPADPAEAHLLDPDHDWLIDLVVGAVLLALLLGWDVRLVLRRRGVAG